MKKRFCIYFLAYLFLTGGPGLSRTVVKFHDRNEVKLALTNNGPSFSYTDSGDTGEPLISGFRYYYSVES